MAPSRRHPLGHGQEIPGRTASEVRSMLIIHQGALGDFILALPTLMTLRKAFPEAKPVIMGYPRILELVEKRFYAEEIVSVDQRGMASFFVRGGDLDPGLSQYFGTFDLIVVFGKETEGSIISNLRRVCQGQIIHLNSFPPRDERIHMTDHLLRELRRNQFSVEEQDPQLFLNRSDQAWGRSYLQEEGVDGRRKGERHRPASRKRQPEETLASGTVHRARPFFPGPYPLQTLNRHGSRGGGRDSEDLRDHSVGDGVYGAGPRQGPVSHRVGVGHRGMSRLHRE